MFGLANRLGVGVLRSLAAQVKAIFAKPGIEPHLYTFGPGVPILGPELVVNGDFSNGTTGWGASNAAAITAVGGELVVTGSATAYPGAVSDSFATVIGATYQIAAKIRRGTCTNDAPLEAKTSSGTSLGIIGSATSTADKFVTGVFTASTTSTRVYYYINGAQSGLTAIADNITVREIVGYSNTYSGFVAGNYFDSAGTTHASVDGSVGLVLDAAGARLPINTDATDGWLANNATLSSSNGVMTVTNTLASSPFAHRAIQCVIGQRYLISVTLTRGTTPNNNQLRVGDSPGGVERFLTTALATSGTYPVEFVATQTTHYLAMGFGETAIGQTSLWKINFAVTGIHASQGTPGFKPTLRKGIVNLLTWSNGLATANWVGSGITAAQNVLAPDGTTTAHTLTIASAFSSFRPSADATVVPGQTYTYAFVAKRGTATDFKLSFYNFTGGADILPATSVYADIGSDWTVVVRTVTIPAGCTALRIFMMRDSGVTGTVFVYRAALFAGTLSAAEILAAGGIPLTTTAPASSLAGPNHLEFVDTNSQCLIRPPASVGASGWAVIAIAASKRAFMCPMGSLGTSNEVGQAGYAFKLRTDGAVWLRIGDGSGNPGNISETLTPANVYQIGMPIVLSMRWVSGGNFVGRVNGVDVGSIVCINPSGTNGGVSIGRHGAIGAEFFSGKIFFAQDGVGAISEQGIAMIEKQAAAAAGFQL